MALEVRLDTSGKDIAELGVSEVVRHLKELERGVLAGENTGFFHDGDGEVIGEWSYA